MWQLATILVIIYSALVVSILETRIDPLVQTKLGLVRGLRSDNGEYSKFLGIPYALVDEENPFSPSIAFPAFDDTFNAYDGSVMCPQVTMQGDIVGVIQCLNLNIYVPNQAHSAYQLPVMVYIHGGAFIEGSGTNIIGTPNSLLEKDVIVVSINYRLGIYGFMCTDSPKAPGNIGLKDQVLALKWINENIGSFGGDNTKVTIFGESAGAMSVHLHLLFDNEKLFNQAIIQSGPATSPWAIEDTNDNVPLNIANILGLITDDLDEAIYFISKVPVELVIAAGDQLKKNSQYSTEPLTKACVEKEFEGVERFVTVNPNVASTEKAKTIPVIIGYASQELIFQHAGKRADFYTNYSFKDLLEFGFDVTDFDDMADLIRHFYIGDETPGEDLQNEITSFASDFIFNHPTERAVNLLLQSENKAVYHYVFSYVGGRSAVQLANTSLVGASHADDISYLFETLFGPNEVTAQDQLMIDRIATLWTNFAKYGNPTPDTSSLLPVKWEPVSDTVVPYLDLNEELTLQFRPFHDRMAFWDLFYKLNQSKAKWF